MTLRSSGVRSAQIAWASVSTATLEEATQRTLCVRLGVSIAISVCFVGSQNLGEGNDHV